MEVLNNFLWTKCYFSILDNLYLGRKVGIWFSEGQKFQFLFGHKNSFKIKHSTTRVVMCSFLFSLADQMHPECVFD
jgi:hypothetical protein